MKILWFSDFDFRSSGYFNISIECSKKLAELGHEVKAIGLGYKGEEHDFPLGIVPAQNIQESQAIMMNLSKMWEFDALIVAADIPVQEGIQQFVQQELSGTKYIGIMPIEADPLCLDWSIILMQMNKALIISEFGTEEARKVGLENVEHIPVGIDTESWRVPSEEERNKFRDALGFGDDFVFLTVAYNQERKFLSRAMEIYAGFVYGCVDWDEVEELKYMEEKPEKVVTDAKYVFVTAEHTTLGWRLRNLAQQLGIQDDVIIFERGMEFKRLWGIYAASDAFILTSKAEGLGMIFMEAMATGLPCLGTDCTGIHELLDDGRGYPIPYDYVICDPFGNGNRYYANVENGILLMEKVYSTDTSKVREKALKYVRGRGWDEAGKILDRVLKEVVDG